MSKNKYDAIVIGAGFYGLRVALYLREQIGLNRILVLEKEVQAMTHASYVNQARVHNGYHYPRSVLTGYRSALNFERFVAEYPDAIVKDFDKYYGIAKNISKVNAHQFEAFCKKIGADYIEDRNILNRYFNPQMTESVYKVKEYAFNSRIIRSLLLARIEAIGGIDIAYGHTVEAVLPGDDVAVHTGRDIFQATKVFNCTYAQLNNLHRRSGLSLLPLKHEITEMCLVELPEGMERFSITLMDGPFFSIMPFPSRGLHTLSHVRYTPHLSWRDDESTTSERHDTYRYKESLQIKTAYRSMHLDVVRFIPALRGMKLIDTISDVKTVLLKSEDDDSRPILFNSNFELKGYTCIMGGKLDNIYDVFEELDILYADE